MPHRAGKLILDALQTCREIRGFTEGKVYNDLAEDRGLQLILERLFEVLGETLSRLRNADEEKFESLTDGHRIIGTRHLLAHGYDIIDHRILWDAVQLNLAQLESELNHLQE